MTIQKMHTRAEQLESFSRLLDVMSELREKCPWDRKQTFESLRCNTVEVRANTKGCFWMKV